MHWHVEKKTTDRFESNEAHILGLSKILLYEWVLRRELNKLVHN